MTSVMSHPKFELRDAGTWADPWPMYLALRDHDPVHHVVPQDKLEDDYYVLSRHEDVWNAAADHETFSSAQGLTVTYGELEMIGLADNPPLVMQDPPQHTRFRKLVARAFTPRHVAELESEVREFCADRIERLRAAGGSGDIVAELFKPLPSLVVAHFLGVPADARRQFDGWSEAIVAANTSPDGVAGAGEAIGAMAAYFTGLIQRRRTDPGEDTISHLVSAGVGADDSDSAGMLSILAFAFTMITGGNDTTTGMLGGSAQLLQQNPDQRRMLSEQPELIRDAIEELLRMTSPVQGLCRTASRDVTIGDVTIPAGRKVMLLYASANRDDRQFGPTAEQLDVLRHPHQILTFGYGAHHCIGNQAARMESRVALEELLTRCPNYRIDEAKMTWAGGSYVRRPLTLPFSID